MLQSMKKLYAIYHFRIYCTINYLPLSKQLLLLKKTSNLNFLTFKKSALFKIREVGV